MNTLIHLTTDDNAPATGLLCDQPEAPTADVLVLLKHADRLARVYAAAVIAADEWTRMSDTVPPLLQRSIHRAMGNLCAEVGKAEAA